MASPQHLGSPVRWHVAIEAEVLHLRRNLGDASLAAGLYTLLDGPVGRPGLPTWMTALSPALRRPAARAARLVATAVYALAAAGAAAAAAPPPHRVVAGAMAASLLALVLVLAVEVPLRRARPVRLRTDVARYLVAEAVLAARDITAGPASATFRTAADALLREVVVSARRLDARLLRSAPGVDPVAATAARYPWLLQQVAALRVTAQRSQSVHPDDVVRGSEVLGS